MSTTPRTSTPPHASEHAPSHRLAAAAVDALAERKAENITILDLRPVGGVADYFVIGTGASERQIRALAGAVDERAEETLGERPWHTEGLEHLQWVVLDYVDVVVHIFSKEKRAYYELERLWGDADIEHVPAEAGSAAVELLQQGAERSSVEE